MGLTLFDKIWNAHVVKQIEDDTFILYIDRHYIHEVTSPQAFASLKTRNLSVFRPHLTTATADHNVPTKGSYNHIADSLSRNQIETLRKNCSENKISLFDLGNEYNGIVHVIGPELGLTLPGMTIVCGDSHTSTHGALGCIAFGIGTSEVEQVLASQCLVLTKPKVMHVKVEGKTDEWVTAKDIILYVVSKIGVSGGTGYFVEYSGSAISDLSIEERMTICNMSIEMGARGGLIAPDEKTITYIRNKPFSPTGKEMEILLSAMESLKTDDDAHFDKEVLIDASQIKPMVTYGTNPGMAIAVSEKIPFAKSDSELKSLAYMNFKEEEKLEGRKIDYVFIGSCTNSRIEDLRAAAHIVKGKKKAPNVNVWIVPGSNRVLKQAKEEGLDQIFRDAGFEFRLPGCSACLAMNDDKIPSGAYCVSTSNRNFEGRQGVGARTILASPVTAALAAITGEISDVRKILIANHE